MRSLALIDVYRLLFARNRSRMRMNGHLVTTAQRLPYPKLINELSGSTETLNAQTPAMLTIYLDAEWSFGESINVFNKTQSEIMTF